MNKIIKWITCKDIREAAMAKKLEIEGYKSTIDSQPSTLCRGIVILTKNIIDLDFSTAKYSRVLIILTGMIIILTVIMLFKNP